MDTNHIPELLELSRELIRKSELQQAEELVLQAVQLDPELALPYAILGVIRFLQDHDSEGEVLTRKAINMNPDVEEVYISLSKILYKNKKYKASKDILNQVLESNGKKKIRSDALYGLSLFHVYKKEYNHAFNKSFKALILSPSLRKLKMMLLLSRKHAILSWVIVTIPVLPIILPKNIAVPLSVLSLFYLSGEIFYSIKLKKQKSRNFYIIFFVVLTIFYLISAWL